MKTSGIIRIYAIGILLALAIFIAGSVFGQYSFASQKRFSLNDTDKQFTADKNFYADTKAISNENGNLLRPAPIFSLEHAANRNIFSTPVIHHNLPVAEINKANSKNDEIAFRTTSFMYPVNSRADIGISEYSPELLIIYAKALKAYAKENSFDTCYAFLSNMGMLSNRKRFFVVNLRTMEIEGAGLVSHGRGQGRTIYDRQYSDEPGSRCTSLGRYKILGKYKGSYGEAYRMVGLDSSNNNAYSRNIVLHSMSCIPDVENRMPACVSDGCPALSGKFLTSLRKFIDSRKKPMLLWVFDSNLLEPVIEENYAEPISPGILATAEKSFFISTACTGKQLPDVANESSHGNKFFKWLALEKKKILKPLSRAKRSSGIKSKRWQFPVKKFFRQQASNIHRAALKIHHALKLPGKK